MIITKNVNFLHFHFSLVFGNYCVRTMAADIWFYIQYPKEMMNDNTYSLKEKWNNSISQKIHGSWFNEYLSQSPGCWWRTSAQNSQKGFKRGTFWRMNGIWGEKPEGSHIFIRCIWLDKIFDLGRFNFEYFKTRRFQN